MTNIAEILKYCPQGIKLYSPICGDCALENIDLGETYSIEVISCSNDTHQLFTSKDAFLDDQKDAECLLFPSKDQRDWDKFRIPVKRGDIMMFEDKSVVFIVKEYTDDFTKTSVEFSDALGTNTHIYIRYIPASEDMKEKLFKAIDDAGYKWNGENLVKKEHQFKPFDKVLVRDDDSELWEPDIFALYDGKAYLKYTCFRNSWRQCIPYDETRVGTKE